MDTKFETTEKELNLFQLKEVEKIKSFNDFRKLEIIKLDVKVTLDQNSDETIQAEIESAHDFFERMTLWKIEDDRLENHYNHRFPSWRKNNGIVSLQNENVTKSTEPMQIEERCHPMLFGRQTSDFFGWFTDSDPFSDEFRERMQQWALITKSVETFLKNTAVNEAEAIWEEMNEEDWRQVKFEISHKTNKIAEIQIWEARDMKRMIENELNFQQTGSSGEYFAWKGGRLFDPQEDLSERIKLWKIKDEFVQKSFEEFFEIEFAKSVRRNKRRREREKEEEERMKQKEGEKIVEMVQYGYFRPVMLSKVSSLVQNSRAQEIKNQETIPLRRGGLVYRRPGPGWARVGFNVKNKFDSDKNWLSREDGWAVGYHGCRPEGVEKLKSIARTLEMQPGSPSESEYAEEIDVNILSDQQGQPCGSGIFFADDIDWVAEYYGTPINGYNCVFQARLKPSKVRIPKNLHHGAEIRIVNEERNVRVYGLCFKKVNRDDDEDLNDPIWPYSKM